MINNILLSWRKFVIQYIETFQNINNFDIEYMYTAEHLESTVLNPIFDIMIAMQMDMVATYNETLLASNDPRKDLPAGFYTMKSLVGLEEDLLNL